MSHLGQKRTWRS